MMPSRPWLRLETMAMLAIAGCGDLRLVDQLQEPTPSAHGGSTASAASGGARLQGGQAGAASGKGGQSNPLGLAGSPTLSLVGGGAGVASAGTGGTVMTGGAGAGTGGSSKATQGGTTNNVAGGAENGAAGAAQSIGGTASGGSRTSSAGAPSLGGTSTGGVTAVAGSDSGGQSGGFSGSGTILGGAAGSTQGQSTAGRAGMTGAGGNNGGQSAGGRTVFTGAAGDGGASCPSSITKPAALLAAEPIPVDRCARVSNVIPFASEYFAYGFTNGEVHIFNPKVPTQIRADSWTSSAGTQSTARAIVTSMVAPMNNNEWALQIGHADPMGSTTKPWRMGALGRGWSEATVEKPGVVMTLVPCPFHGGSPLHFDLATPWILQGSINSGASYNEIDAGTVTQHLKLGRRVTALDIVTQSEGWFIYAGTEFGEIYVSNLLSGRVTWDDATDKLSTEVAWVRINDGAGMPQQWITRLAVHPSHPERIFVVVASSAADSVWYSGDAGKTWENRHGDLPTTYNKINTAPPVLGISFNPVVEGAAYAVTSVTSYYTLDYGGSWKQW